MCGNFNIIGDKTPPGHLNVMDTTTLHNYKRILSEIAIDKGLKELADFIQTFEPKVPVEKGEHFGPPVYNITKLPEATCDGCQ